MSAFVAIEPSDGSRWVSEEDYNDLRTEEPIAWGLFNPMTGKLDARVYQSAETAKSGAERHSSRWRILVAVPLFAGIPSSEDDT